MGTTVDTVNASISTACDPRFAPPQRIASHSFRGDSTWVKGARHKVFTADSRPEITAKSQWRSWLQAVEKRTKSSHSTAL